MESAAPPGRVDAARTPGASYARRTPSASGDSAPDALDLAQVQQIVAGIQAAEMLQALLPAFDVHPYSFQVGRGRALQQAKVRTPKHRKQFERF